MELRIGLTFFLVLSLQELSCLRVTEEGSGRETGSVIEVVKLGVNDSFFHRFT